MQKRVLAFLMVMAMVFSLLPVSLVGAETGAEVPAFTMLLQKAHNQTDGSLAIDIYLQSTVDANVTGYQFTVTPADGLTWTGVTDNTGNDNVKASKVVVYDPAAQEPIVVGTSRVLVATVTVTGATLPENFSEAITLTDATVTTEDASYVPAMASVAYGCTEHTCGHGEGEWTALTAAYLTDAGYVLGTGNYYLTENIAATKKLTVTAADAKVNLCVNGYTYTSPTADKLMEVTGEGAEVNICDCTATGEGEELVAGKFLLKYANWGNFRLSSVDSKLNCANVIIEGAEDAVFSSTTNDNVGNAATFYQGTKAAGSSIYVENVLIKDIHAKTLVDTRAEGYYKNVTFVNCSGGENSETDQLAIFATNGAHASSGTRALTIDGCKFIDCVGDVLDTNGKSGITYTLKGDVQAEGAFYVTNTCTLNLELGTKADVTIRTQTDKTEETLGDNVVIPEGATLPAGTLLYKNADLMVDYQDGVFSFSGHAHGEEYYEDGTGEGHTVEGLSFKAWDDSSTLPTEGNWYLTTDVNMTAHVNVAANTTLNLDLNGHTVTQTTSKARHILVNGTLNLFDCQSGYDDDGNWTGGQLTGGSHDSGASICVSSSAKDETDVRPTFNMYGGRIAGNHTASSGGAVYVFYSQTVDTSVRAGGIFNMYGGELYNNVSNAWGGAVTVMGYSATATSGTKGADPALGIGAQFNMHGGKIHGNVTNKGTDTTSYADGTINIQQDAQMTMTGGEICDNAAERGGAFYIGSTAAKLTITGGSIYNNTAVEDAYKRTQVKYTLNSSNQATAHTVYMGKGGAIYCNYGTVVVQNANIYGNTATLGGAIYAGGGSATNVLVENCVIDDNTAYDYRTEAIAATEVNTSNAEYTDQNNEWGNGGALYVTGTNSVVTVRDSHITNNRSAKAADLSDYTGTGGGVYVYGTKYLTLEGCALSGNDAGIESGGALNLRASGTTADVRNCVITNNTAGKAGAGIYAVNNSILKLTDTVIYNNTNTGTVNGAGVYITSTGTRIILSGKVVIDKNANKNGEAIYRNLYFQSQSGRTKAVEVNELGAGSHVEMYLAGTSSTVYKNDLASGYVQITDGGSQSDWECGWITVGAESKGNRQVAYIDLTDDGTDNKTFEWGHYHKRADGTYYLLNEWTSTTSLPKTTDDNGVGYYLTGNVTIGTTNDVTFTEHKATGYDFELCLNGFTIVPGTNAKRAIVLRSGNAWIGDCTASYDENGYLLAGGIIKGAHNSENGGALYFTDDQNIGYNVTVSGIELSGNYETTKRNGIASPGYSGGAIHARNKNSSTDNGDVSVIGCKFTGNYTPMEGGAINSLNGVDFTITDTVFEGNYAGRLGGAISMIGASSAKGELVIDNCRFIDNYVTSNPTNWTDDTTTDEDETITPTRWTGLGGAIYATYSTVTVTDSYFQGNQAINKETLTNIDYTTDIAVGSGGAIFMYQNANLSLDGCEFDNNYAQYEGGAVYYYNGTQNTITDTVFSNNSANQFGGAVFVLNSAAALSINGTAEAPVYFYDNTAPGQVYTNSEGTEATVNGYGGAIEVMNSTASINYAYFYNNSSRSSGGAVRLGGGGGATKVYSLTNSLFVGNRSTNGMGGALFVHAVTSPMTIQNTDFYDNQAATHGGAIRLQGTVVTSSGATVSVPDINIIGGMFVGNSSASYGGVMSVANTTTLSVSGAHFEANKSNLGGVIYTANSTVITSFDNCDFLFNTATSGGVAAHDWQKTATYTGCNFSDNTATSNGGVMYLRGNDNAVVTIGGAGDAACTFTGNTANSGGAVWCGSSTKSSGVYYAGSTNIINSAFRENVAHNDVAAVKSCNGHQLTISDSTITENTSKIFGALHVATSNASLTMAGKMTVTDNVSTNYVAFAENTDLFFQGYTDATLDARVDVSGLTEGSEIGVMAQDARMAQNTDLTKNSGAAMFDYFYSNSDRVLLTTKDGEIHAVKYIDEDGNIYGTVQAAIEAAEAAEADTFKLQAATSETLTMTTLDYIDLNGYNVNKIVVPEGMTLDIVDSTTNDYDCADGYGSVTVEGSYNVYVEDSSSGSLKRYVVLADEEGKLSAHRIYLAITAKALRPSSNGVGFKAIFAGDQVVTENVAYGLELSGYSNFREVWTAQFYAMESGLEDNTPNEKTVVIYNAITAEDQSRWDADLYGRPFITIGNQLVYGTTVTVNMKAMAANALNSGDATIIEAVQAMMTACGVSVD